MKSNGNKIVAILSSLFMLISGCASITNSSTQNVRVITFAENKEVRGSKCQIANSRGVWKLETPNTIEVHRSSSPLDISCHKDNFSGKDKIESVSTGLIVLNVFMGGVVGAAIDGSSGAGSIYPTDITLFMKNDSASVNEIGDKNE